MFSCWKNTPENLKYPQMDSLMDFYEPHGALGLPPGTEMPKIWNNPIAQFFGILPRNFLQIPPKSLSQQYCKNSLILS